MTEIFIIAEGQSEEAFIKRVIAPDFLHSQKYIKPTLLRTSKEGRGGAVNFDRLKHYARNILRAHPDTFVTTLIDLYGLDTSFPDYQIATTINDLTTKLTCLESALHREIINFTKCREKRFIAHIQPHEFEAVLFSNIDQLCSTEPAWATFKNDLTQIKNSFSSPEEINNSPETKPSKRLEILSPKYRKTLHGPQAAQAITLTTIEQECPHFAQWIVRLRNL